jgi:hypothetical protein
MAARLLMLTKSKSLKFSFLVFFADPCISLQIKTQPTNEPNSKPKNQSKTQKIKFNSWEAGTEVSLVDDVVGGVGFEF